MTFFSKCCGLGQYSHEICGGFWKYVKDADISEYGHCCVTSFGFWYVPLCTSKGIWKCMEEEGMVNVINYIGQMNKQTNKQTNKHINEQSNKQIHAFFS